MLKDVGMVLYWLVCLSELVTDPTMDTDHAFVLLNDRTSFAFDVFIKDVNIDVAMNEIVRGMLML